MSDNNPFGNPNPGKVSGRGNYTNPPKGRRGAPHLQPFRSAVTMCVSASEKDALIKEAARTGQTVSVLLRSYLQDILDKLP